MKKYSIIAVDFDGTLCKDQYPEIGEANRYLIQLLKELQANGSRLILWTCRTNEILDQAIAWSREQGLIFDEVNRNLPEVVAKYGGDSRKIFADVYIDDKSCFPWKTNERMENLE